MMAPIILSIFLIILFIGVIGSLFRTPNPDRVQDDFGQNYNEAAFQRAADEKYADYFDHDETYEDNILLYFLVEEGCEDIYFIAWVGDNINYDISYLFGNNESEFGQAIYNNVANYYAYSLDTNLASVINEMQKHILSLELESSFIKEPAIGADPAESKLIDLTYRTSDGGRSDTEPQLTASTVNDALRAFAETTGIRTIIAVDYIDNVFPDEESSGCAVSGTSVFAVFAIVFLVVVIIIVTKNSKKEKENK